MSRLKLEQRTFGENLNLISDLDKTNAAVKKVCDYVLGKSAFCEGFEKNPVNDIIVNRTIDDMKNKVLSIAKPLSEYPDTDKTYADTLGNAMAVVVNTKADYEVQAPTVTTIDELLQQVNDTSNELADVSDNASKEFDHHIEETVDDLEAIKDDLTFEPAVDSSKEPAKGGLVPVAERAASAEDDVSLFGLFNLVMFVPAVIANTANNIATSRFADKYGTSTTIKQPLLTTSSLSNETVKQLAKALEVKMGLELKATLEATAAANDGGLVNKRLRNANILSPAKIDVKKFSLFSKNHMDYNEILSVFSEGKIQTDILGQANSDVLYVLPSCLSYFRENMEYLETAMLREYVVGTGEAGIELMDEKRAALPTTLTVDIKYTTAKSLAKFDRETKDMKTTISIEVNPKIVNQNEFVSCIVENNMAKIKVSKDERTQAARFYDIIKFWKKKPQTPQAKVLKTTAMSRLLAKISNIKTPLFHIMMEYSDYLALKKAGIDMMNHDDYKTVMGALPIISVTIVVEDTGLVYMSEGPVCMYNKRNIKDYVSAGNTLEKEMRSVISFRNNL